MLSLCYCSFQIAGVTIETETPGFVKDENDEKLTGQLFEEPALTKILEKAPRPTPVEMKKAVEEQLKDYASRGFTTVTDLAFAMKSDDTEISNRMLRILKNVSESKSCSARLALYRVVHGPDDSNSSSKPKAVCCPSLVRFDGHEVKFNIQHHNKYS